MTDAPKLKDLDLSSKEAYLAWVDHWKATYKQLSNDIRESKRVKIYHRDIARLGGESASWHREKMSSAYGTRVYLRWKAHEMMAARQEGKELSWAARCKSLGEENLHASQLPKPVASQPPTPTAEGKKIGPMLAYVVRKLLPLK